MVKNDHFSIKIAMASKMQSKKGDFLIKTEIIKFTKIQRFSM